MTSFRECRFHRNQTLSKRLKSTNEMIENFNSPNSIDLKECFEQEAMQPIEITIDDFKSLSTSSLEIQKKINIVLEHLDKSIQQVYMAYYGRKTFREQIIEPLILVNNDLKNAISNFKLSHPE